MTKTLLRFSALLLFLLFTARPADAQLSSTQIDSLVKRAMEEFHVAGAAIAIVKDGRVVHEKGYGVKSVETRQPVDAHTNFQIASNSKAFTTAALAILVDEGKLSWKDKVTRFLPEFKMYDSYVTENFLVEDLLCHRSGLGLGVGDLMEFPDGSDFTIQDVLTCFQHFKPVSAFRTQFDYDNQLYLVAGELIARVSGMSWEQFVQTRIIQPLGMSHSFCSAALMTDQNHAMPHKTEQGKIIQIPLFKDMMNGAAGGIFSNVHDLTLWMQMHLNQGRYGANQEKQLFSVEQQLKMWQIHTVLSAYPNQRYNPHFSGYGLGWGLGDIRGNLKVTHTGGLPGMLTQVYMIPDQKLGIVILTNTESGGAALFRALNNSIVDSYLGIEKEDWIGIYAGMEDEAAAEADSVTAAVWKQVEQSRKVKINAQDYVGLYQDPWFGRVEVFLKGDDLWFRCLRSPKLNGPMRLYKANTFAIRWEYQDMNCDAFAMFSLDEEGRAGSIKMKGISPNIDFSFDFHDLDLVRVKE